MAKRWTHFSSDRFKCTCTFCDILIVKNVIIKKVIFLWCNDKDSVGFWFCCLGFLSRGGEKNKQQVAGWMLRYDVGSTPSGRALFKWRGHNRKLLRLCSSIKSSRLILMQVAPRLLRDWTDEVLSLVVLVLRVTVLRPGPLWTPDGWHELVLDLLLGVFLQVRLHGAALR